MFDPQDLQVNWNRIYCSTNWLDRSKRCAFIVDNQTIVYAYLDTPLAVTGSNAEAVCKTQDCRAYPFRVLFDIKLVTHPLSWVVSKTFGL